MQNLSPTHGEVKAGEDQSGTVVIDYPPVDIRNPSDVYLFAEEDDQAEMLLAFAKLSKSARSKLLELAKQMAAEKAKK
jgi:hypothetical protein